MDLNINGYRKKVKNIYFSSDFHFNHTNVIKHCSRPFSTVEEMDASIIGNINESVEHEDFLFYLGDFCFRDRNRDFMSHEMLAAKYRSKLNCNNVYFMWGNHDKRLRSSKLFKGLWKGTYDLLEIEIDGVPVVLCHYPLKSWNKARYGAIHLYGHCHGELDKEINSLDVGVDCWNFKPVNFIDVLKHQSTFGAKQD